MKFLNKLYRFTTKSISARRTNIFLSVSLLVALVAWLCILLPNVITAMLLGSTLISYIFFTTDTLFYGGAIDRIEDTIMEFKKFK